MLLKISGNIAHGREIIEDHEAILSGEPGRQPYEHPYTAPHPGTSDGVEGTLRGPPAQMFIYLFIHTQRNSVDNLDRIC
jgi:hypothetical protein